MHSGCRCVGACRVFVLSCLAGAGNDPIPSHSLELTNTARNAEVADKLPELYTTLAKPFVFGGCGQAVMSAVACCRSCLTNHSASRGIAEVLCLAHLTWIDRPSPFINACLGKKLGVAQPRFTDVFTK